MNTNYSELYARMMQLSMLLRRQQRLKRARRGPAFDPTQGQGRILALLKIRSGLPTRDLAYLLGIRQQSLNELLNKLEKGGYVERRPSEEDRRVMLVYLTEKGNEADLDLSGHEKPEAFLDFLTQEEVENLETQLERIIKALIPKVYPKELVARLSQEDSLNDSAEDEDSEKEAELDEVLKKLHRITMELEGPHRPRHLHRPRPGFPGHPHPGCPNPDPENGPLKTPEDEASEKPSLEDEISDSSNH